MLLAAGLCPNPLEELKRSPRLPSRYFGDRDGKKSVGNRGRRRELHCKNFAF